MSLKSFEDLDPSTITMLGQLTERFDLINFLTSASVLKELTLSEQTLERNKKPKYPLVKEKGILSMRLAITLEDFEVIKEFAPDAQLFEQSVGKNDDVSKRYWVCRGLPGPAPFSTSLTIDYSGGGKNFNVKVFQSRKEKEMAKMHITGCRSYEETIALITRIVREAQRKEVQATPIKTTIEYCEAQTINYHFEVGHHLDLQVVNELFYHHQIINGYDNLTSNQIELIFPSNASKEHLKSKKEAVTKVRIQESGRICINGLLMEEIEEIYYKIMNIFQIHSGKLKPVFLVEMEEEIMALFNKDKARLMTPLEIRRLLDKDSKTINSILDSMIRSCLLTRIERENGGRPRYRLYSDESYHVQKDDPQIRDDILAMFKCDNDEYLSNEIANEVIGNDLRENLSLINSTLHKLQKENILKVRFKEKSNLKYWHLVTK